MSLDLDVIPDYGWLPRYLRIPGAHMVGTASFRAAQNAISEAVLDSGIAVMYGESGAGKTFATRVAVGTFTDLPVTWYEPDSRQSMLLMSQRLLRALGGHQTQGRKGDLVDPLLELLAAPQILVVDEAQRLSRECVDHLRYLHDQCRTDFTLVLSGGRGCMETLSREPQLARRTPLRVEFTRLTEDEVVEYLPSYHAIYRDVPPGSLLQVDRIYAHGMFGLWVNFTKRFTRAQERLGSGARTDDLIEVALVELDAID
jgi:hypothetical protein